MNGILIIDKPYGITSRDVVNKIVHILGTKKVGHTGTLDPIATGVLVICVGSATKLVEELTSTYKEYIAEVELGTNTDTLDSTGNIIKEESAIKNREEIIKSLNEFNGFYNQEVPIYSAVKINGKKLYEYAREDISVELPKREVEIKNIELVGDIEYKNSKTIFTFKCTVSKGTYIRSLIRDIAVSLNTIGIMTSLIRTKQGKFDIKDAIKLDSVSTSNIISINDALEIKKIELDNTIEKKVLNGVPIDDIYNSEKVLFIKNNEAIALYRKEKDILKPYKMFKGGII